jgi:hypothetical protein
MGGFDSFIEQCNPANIPTASKDVMLVCGILDLFLFGVLQKFLPISFHVNFLVQVGTIVLGCVTGNMWTACVGVVQLLLFFVGWLWSFVS